jgi:hypothetical protein
MHRRAWAASAREAMACGAFAILVASSAPLHAQWLYQRDARIPRTKDGRADLTAPTPRASDGKPDLSGVWAAVPSEELKGFLGPDPGSNPLGADLQFISKYALNVFFDLKPGEEPMRPEAAAVFRQRMESNGQDSPTSHCLPGGIPFSSLIAPFKIVQTPRLTVMLFEDNNPPRQIHTDGRKHPADPEPTWVGYSVGRWEGDALVVETVGFNDRTWLDGFGHPHSDAMRVVERFRRRDLGHLDLQITIDDRKMYTKPFTVNAAHRLLPDTDVLEAICAENEKDRSHIAASSR